MGGVLLVTWLDLGAVNSLDNPRGLRILVSGLGTFFGLLWTATYGLKLGRDVMGAVF